MKFFFPDSQDQIDPSFDFVTEERSIFRIRQRDDRYAHEALSAPPFSGFLVSKGAVDGLPGAAGRYSIAQRQRLYRVGVREFFRLDMVEGPRLASMGDCGAFSYVRDETPPYTPDEVIDFYAECDFDFGISVDHVILGYDLAADSDPDHPNAEDWRGRQELTLQLAQEFLHRCRVRKVAFEPMGVAQGWSPDSYALAVRELQKMGYSRIALGGLVPLRTENVLDCLRRINEDRASSTELHLLGITRCENVEEFGRCGATSFDSTSPFRQAFKDATDNYYAVDRTYTAVRVPQVDANPKLKGQIRAGQIDQTKALKLEHDCLTRLRRYDAGELKLATVLRSLEAYDELCQVKRDNRPAYEEILVARPWRDCRCGICGEVGIDVAMFRGSERNKRRGFHNLYVFNQRLQRELAGVA